MVARTWLGFALVFLFACTPAGREEPQCLSTNDCRSGVCAFDACRALCTHDAECGSGGTCFSLGSGNEGVCSLPVERACDDDEQCAAELVCSHGACRVACKEDDDCGLSGQVCKQSGCINSIAAPSDAGSAEDRDDQGQDGGLNALPASISAASSSPPAAFPSTAMTVPGPTVAPDLPTASSMQTAPPAPTNPLPTDSLPTNANTSMPTVVPTSMPTVMPMPTPASLCGNGKVDEGEECDDGNWGRSDGCSALCIQEVDWFCPVGGLCVYSVFCGDGILTGEEDCDDGNMENADGCSAQCTRDEFWECPVAGTACLVDCDVRGTSACEDDPELCELPCAEGARCGDGIVQDEEACDNQVNADHYYVAEGNCAPGCVLPRYCGDGLVSGLYSEQCDNGDANSDTQYNGCTQVCTLGPHCGDGVLSSDFEECDDGNRSNNDGCDAGCSIETAFTASE